MSIYIDFILTLLFTDQCLLQQMRPRVTIVMIPQLKVIMMLQYFEEKTQTKKFTMINNTDTNIKK